LLLQGVATESQTEPLLRAAGVLSVYQRAGTLPATNTNAVPTVCPAESLPRSGPRTAAHLGVMLSGNYPDLIPVALAAMAETAQRVPEELLPAIMDLSERKQTLIAPLAAVGGAHGKWLAAQNPNWDWLNRESSLPDDVQSFWETSALAQRLGLLHQLRKTAPEKARELIASTWGEDKADLRAQFIGALRDGLTMADEPFLEGCLDDKSIVVRRAAADVLADLPDSRLCLRMEERLRSLLQLKSKGLLRRTDVLDVNLPAGADTAMQRDGIRAQASAGHAGEKASLIAQMLALVPPSSWSSAYAKSPNELLAAAEAGDWKDLLWSAWAKAAERHRDADWALALTQALPAEAALQSLLRILPEEQRDDLLCRAAKDADDVALISQISRFPGPWSLRLTQAVLKRIRKAGETERPYLSRATLAALPLLHPQAAAEVSADWPAEMSDLAAALQFKAQMLQDIRNRC
jgi:hypothetical protein